MYALAPPSPTTLNMLAMSDVLCPSKVPQNWESQAPLQVGVEVVVPVGVLVPVAVAVTVGLLVPVSSFVAVRELVAVPVGVAVRLGVFEPVDAGVEVELIVRVI